MEKYNEKKDYKSKYHYYKRKYLDLKKDLEGGNNDDPINAIIYSFI